MASSILTVIFGPFVGRLIDKFGVRRIGVPGLAAFCIAFALLFTMSSSVLHWWLHWIFLAITMLFIKITLWSTAVVKRFEAQRGLALALALTGAGVAVSLLPLIGNWLIESFGWRFAYAVIGVGAFLISMPMVLAFLYDSGRDAPPEGSTARSMRCEATALAPGLSVPAALHSRQFWLLCLSTLFVVTPMLGLQVHMIPIMVEDGLHASTAALVMLVVGLTSVTSRIATGYFLDRWHGALLGRIVYALPVVGVVLLMFSGGDLLVLIFAAAILGVALGAEVDIMSYLTARYFGTKNYGALYGIMVGLLVLGGGIGPQIASLIYDVWGSYQYYFWFVIPCFSLSSIFVGSCGPYPVFKKQRRPSFL
jgi:MFS family permease